VSLAQLDCAGDFFDCLARRVSRVVGAHDLSCNLDWPVVLEVATISADLATDKVLVYLSRQKFFQQTYVHL